LIIPLKYQRAWYGSDSKNLLSLDVGEEGADVEWASSSVPAPPDGISLKWDKISRETGSVNRES